MKIRRLTIIRILFLIVLFISASALAGAQDNRGYKSPRAGLSGRSVSKTEVRIREPRSVRKAKKKQEAKEKKLKKDYEAFVKEGRKRSYQIQSPEVKERMKANSKETTKRYKEKNKRNAETTGKAGKKY